MTTQLRGVGVGLAPPVGEQGTASRPPTPDAGNAKKADD